MFSDDRQAGPRVMKSLVCQARQMDWSGLTAEKRHGGPGLLKRPTRGAGIADVWMQWLQPSCP